MKKILFVAAAIMASMTACNKEEANVTPPASESKVWVEFTAGAVTKAALVEGEGKHSVVWEKNDAISVNGETLSTTESGAKVVFAGEVSESFLAAENYSAVYPASAGTGFSEITVKAEQTTTNDAFDDIVAVAYSADRSLQFKHVTSLIRFQVPSGFTVNTVTFSADEALAGKVSVAMDSETATPKITVTEGVKTVTLKCPEDVFTAGKDYYVAVLPGEKTNLTVRFNGYLSKKWASPVTIKQGYVANAKVLPAPVASDVKVKVESAKYTTYVEGDYSVLRNVKLSSTYKIVDANSNELRGVASTTPLNSWCYLYKAANSMSGLNGIFDIYVYKSKSSFCIVNTGAAVPQYDSTNQTFYFMYQNTDWWGLYAWDGSDYLLGSWENCGANRLGEFTTPDGKKCSYWALPARANNKTINVVVRNSGASVQSKDTSIKLTGDTESWQSSWDGKAVIGTYVLVPYKF